MEVYLITTIYNGVVNEYLHTMTMYFINELGSLAKVTNIEYSAHMVWYLGSLRTYDECTSFTKKMPDGPSSLLDEVSSPDLVYYARLHTCALYLPPYPWLCLQLLDEHII